MPVNLKAPWEVPMAQARESQPVAGVLFVDRHVLLDAAQLAELGLDDEALGVGHVHDLLGDGDVLVEGLGGGIDHHGAVEAGVDAVDAGSLIAVVQVHREDGLGEDLVGGSDNVLKHQLVGVAARTLGNLDDERGLALNAPAEQSRCKHRRRTCHKRA